MMFAVNDTVMYGNAGVCEIVDIRAQKFYQQPEKLYYVLKPIYEHNETIYCPVDTIDSEYVRFGYCVDR